ncbi:nitrate/nitrite-specific signal transduction histidine kinase [Pedobacter sp. W3I1]|uniref:tetratricopeptide repeat-containing sensor histidine kinase n=1 Tax=Pedobacter sp. W3I1 TaxID=3042291 RepID=UPI00278B95FD|nr:tetratricopeptide repeat-containing sensor histidine kinase [Pedobacter sp. W3I1]MDQ0636890.1 nitrate/nitrite-specific signal transduction histidine kinase [Pedobacter sp. W3I1]
MKKIYFLLFFLLAVFACKKKNNTQAPIKNQNFEIAESFFFKNNDSSFYYFNKVTTTSKDSLQVAMAYNYMAVIQSDAGDYFGGQESLTLSLSFLNEQKQTDLACLASNYNELGLNSTYFKKYSDAINYYNLALKFCRNDSYKLRFLNNKALAYQKSGAYSKAIDIYNEVLIKISDKKEYARVLSNAAKTKWLQNPSYNPLADFSKALQIRYLEKDEWGQNASYSHFADYYEKKKPDSAFSYLQKMYLIATKLNSPDDRLEALQKLIKLSPATTIKQLFQKYQSIEDSLQTARNAAKNQFALIRYETEKSKADYLNAKAENIQKQKDILVRNIGIATLILCLLLGYFLYRKRKKSLQQEKEIEVKKTELKYVKKIHDRVANRVYQVMSEVENTTEIDKDDLADKLDVIYKISRDLSYDNKDIHNEENFSIELSKMLYAYASAKTNITIEGGGEKLWEAINDDTKAEVFCVLQELMTNMKKHSGADTVTINFKRENDRITVLYVDNGKGMEVLTPKNGLRNTETRIESISGHITFDTRPDGGLRIEFSFPTL